MPRHNTEDHRRLTRNIEKYGSIFDDDEQMEHDGWKSLALFALVFISIGAGLAVVIVEWII